MSTHEPIADRDRSPAPTGADTPSRSAAVSAPACPRAGAAGPASAGVVSATLGDSPAGSVIERESGRAPEPESGPCPVPEPARDSRVSTAPGLPGGTGAGAAGADQAGAEQEPGTGPAPAGAPDDEADEEAEGSGRWARDLLLLVGICLLTLLLVNAFVARPFAVPSGSMENTLMPGDRLVANKLAYAFGGHVRRGDVVVFDGTGSFLPESAAPRGAAGALRALGQDLGLAPAGDTVYVKRVIGVGGDRITSPGPDGPLTVNGVPLDESSYLRLGDAPSSVAFDIVVPAGKLWVMGDHRNASRDSRDHLGEPGGGFVPEDKVIGRADWVVFPVGHWTSLDRPAPFAALGGTGGHGDQG
ncbi:signal peptidase I [Streptomyces sp. CB03911]|uniref:signal peptidase I n=1 Tax=Streptomyces sp. CB03911 TaxID=1804758 RepID=UPI0009A11CDA|nr:signal peptidase I [Streptomyces sp. CB03911]